MQHYYFDDATYVCLRKKNGQIFDLYFLSICSFKDKTKTHSVICPLIGMFNSNPMIPQLLQLVEYSQIYSHLCQSPFNILMAR